MITNPFGLFREECISLTKKAMEEEKIVVGEGDIRFATPKDSSFGNLSISTFNMARSIGTQPREVAERIGNKINSYKKNLVSKVECAGGGYINFFIDHAQFDKITLDTVVQLGSSYGMSQKTGRKVIVEHTSVNPIHPIHIGGARNSVLGDCLSRILTAAGNDVKRHFYIDDVGLQVAQASYGFGSLGEIPVRGKSDHFIGQVYASTSCSMNIKRLKAEIKELGCAGREGEAREKMKELDDWTAAAAELRQRNAEVFDAISGDIFSVDDPEGEVNRLLKRYEGREADAVKLIRKLSELALSGFRETLSRVDIEFDSWDWESDLASWSGRAEEVVSALSRTDFVKIEKGTIILDTELTANRFRLKEKYAWKTEVPPLTLKRSDGTTLYTTRDIAYTLWKFERADDVINVISIEQKLPQTQLKIALYALGKGELADRLVHFSYELVHLPGYKMSGRRGRYVSFDEVLDEAVERAYKEVSSRSPHLSEEERRRISEVVGIGAVRYALISVAQAKPITFTWDRVLNFEQNSAPFIQYAHARASNILAKAGGEWAGEPKTCSTNQEMRVSSKKQEPEYAKPEYTTLASKFERDLVVMLGALPDIVEEAAHSLRPEMIAEYSNGLASTFNLFYDNVPVLKTEDAAIREARMLLVQATKVVLANALSLIGITAPSRM